MWEFIVMGQIPGTSIQVNFVTWLFIVASLLLLALIYRSLRAALSNEATAASEQLIAAPESRSAPTQKRLTMPTKLLLAYRLHRAVRTAAYGRWLIAKQQIRA